MSQTLAGWSVQVLANATTRIETLRADLVQAPAELGALVAGTHAALMSASGVAAFTYGVILLLAGIGVEWLYWPYAYSSLRAITARCRARDRRSAR